MPGIMPAMGLGGSGGNVGGMQKKPLMQGGLNMGPMQKPPMQQGRMGLGPRMQGQTGARPPMQRPMPQMAQQFGQQIGRAVGQVGQGPSFGMGGPPRAGLPFNPQQGPAMGNPGLREGWAKQGMMQQPQMQPQMQQPQGPAEAPEDIMGAEEAAQGQAQVGIGPQVNQMQDMMRRFGQRPQPAMVNNGWGQMIPREQAEAMRRGGAIS